MTSLPFTRRNLVAACLLAGLMLSAATLSSSLARAQEENRVVTFTAAMEQLAKDVKVQLNGASEQAISVQGFTGPSGTSAGPKIKKALEDQLKSMEVNVVGANAFSISGKYRGKKNPESGKFEIQIESTITDRLGDDFARLSKQIFTNEEEGLAILGATAELPAQPSPSQVAAGATVEEARAQKVIESIVAPQVFIDGPVVKPNKDSLFSVEVLVIGQQPQPVPVPAVPENNVAFVNLSPDQIYALRITNNAPFDVGVAITIDGINMFEFSKNLGYKKLGKVVVLAGSSAIIKGWHVEGDQSHAFQITKVADSAAAKFNSLESIGTITATFCAAVPKGVPFPDGEPNLGSKGDIATGLGPIVQQVYRDVVVQFGAVRSVISIRYDKPDLTDAPPAEAP